MTRPTPRLLGAIVAVALAAPGTAARAQYSLDEAKITGIHKVFHRDTRVIAMSIDMMGDLNEHLGQLIAYARMNGVKPPWSK